ncbi:FAD-dependent monooxygenase [Bradyrhizobium sp. 14AA]
MRVNVIGGGPGGLYAAILLKKQNPDAEIRVFERNAKDSTFGFGIVLSVETLGRLEEADPASCATIRSKFTYWDDLYIWFKGQSVRSRGHGFSGLERLTLLNILQSRADELGVECVYSHNVTSLGKLADADLVVVSDGVYSLIREQYRDRFKPSVEVRPNRFVWLGSSIPLPGFTFMFKENEHGVWVVHSYQYKDGASTFVVETTPEAFDRAGLKEDDEAETVAYVRKLFSEELKGHTLTTNKSVWRQFPVVNCERWHFDNVVLLGDAAHTAHYSIGSGTKLAMEDAIALAACLKDNWSNVPKALSAYEQERRPPAERIQRAAEISLRWFEALNRYWPLSPVAFNFSLLTRSKQITYENLKRRDPEFIDELNRSIAGDKEVMVESPVLSRFNMADVPLENRLVEIRGEEDADVETSASLVLAPPAQMFSLCRGRKAESADKPFGATVAVSGTALSGTGWLSNGEVAALDNAGASLLELDLSPVQTQCRLSDLSRVVSDARSVWPKEKTLAVRIGNQSLEDASFELARAAREAGASMIHVRAQSSDAEGPTAMDMAGAINLAERIKLELGGIVLLSNAATSDDERNTVIGANRADLVSLESAV